MPSIRKSEAVFQENRRTIAANRDRPGIITADLQPPLKA